MAVVAAVAVVVAHIIAGDQPSGEWTYLIVVCGAAVAAALRARRPGMGRVARLIAIGVGLSAAADVVWQVSVWTHGVAPDVSVADIGWLGSYVAIVAAVLAVLGGSRSRLDIDGLLDVAAITVVGLLVQWNLSLHDIVFDASVSVGARIVWAMYPVLDAVLLALVARAVLARRLHGSLALLVAGGAACWLLADSAFTVPSVADGYSVWLDAGWMMGAILLACAAWSPVPLAGAATRNEGPSRAAYSSIAVALVPLLIPSGLEVAGTFQDDGPDPVPLFVAAVVLVAIAFARTARSLRAEALARSLLRSRERYAHAVARNSSDAVAVLDAEGRISAEAPLLGELVGHPDAITEGVDVFTLVAPTDRDDARAMFERCLATPGQTFESELRVRHEDSHERWLGVRVVNLLHDADVAGVVVNLHDITDRKRAEMDLAHQAFHDGLTGLANRALFTDRVQQALRRNAREGRDTAVIFLDLDAFKTVNDSLGHGPGDELLREVASRLGAAVRSGDTVARLGGDEFAVLVEQSRRAVAEAESVASRILALLQSPIVIGEQTVTVSASLGIASADATATAASLLRDADIAMYRAKAAGKARWVVYEPEMRSAAVERLQIETDLFGALDHGQLRLVYQPVVELEGERVIGFEALLRWDHPTLGPIAPDRFIPIAEENGQIVPIGRWVLAEACRTAARWQHEYGAAGPLSMAVNVSGRQLAYGDMIADVAAVLEETGLEPTTLVIEVTETSLVHDTTTAAHRLMELSALGVRIAIDDFGTGYSSLSYLRQFPVDILKIDRSFINTITDREQVPAIVRGLLDLARALDLAVVAEGVEMDVQRDSLRDEDCALAQGFLFARPMESADAELLVMGLATEGAEVEIGPLGLEG